MHLLKTIIYIFYLIITLSIIKIFPSNANNYIETFNIPNDFQENALVLDYNDSIIGIITIKPKEKIFGEYTWLKLYKLEEKNLNINEWLNDRLHNEIHNIIKIERLLRGPDSPLLETIFNSARTEIPSIDDTIKKATINPEWFCEDLNDGFNKEGKYTELYCTYPLGLFRYYLVLRLQKINNLYYYISASALNHIRIRKVLEIANSFSLK